jgi:hypothetical protein
MALIIEDGSIVTDANSYVTIAEYREYGATRGLTITDDDTLAEQQLIRSMDYLLTYEDDYQGYRTSETQTLSFPRTPVYIYGFDVSETIPDNLKNGQSRLAYDAASAELLINSTGQEVIETAVGPLKKKFNPSGTTNPQATFTEALAILDPLFREGAGNNINVFVDR